MTVVSKAVRADEFRDELVMHIRKMAAVHTGAVKVLLSKSDISRAQARALELNALADFLAVIVFTNIKDK